MARKIVLCSLLILICHTLLLAQSDFEEIVTQAKQAFEQGQYAEAAELYTVLVESGAHDFDVFFNQGLAYYNAGNLGYALVAFRRAQAINPRVQALNLNIARVRVERVDFLPDDFGVLNSVGASTQTLFTTVELSWLTFILWTAWFSYCLFLSLRRRWSQEARIGVLASGAIVFALVFLLFSRMNLENNRPLAVVVLPSVEVMSGPAETYMPLYRLYSATELRIVDRESGWVRFFLGDGRQGWMPDSAILETGT